MQLAIAICEKIKILEEFQKISLNKLTIHNNFTPQKDLFSIDKAVLFPFNKEVHSLLRYSNLLSFTITGVYDVKYAASVGAKTTHLLKDANINDLLVKNINDLNFEEFDTMILGHTTDLIKLMDDNFFVKRLIDNLLKKGKKYTHSTIMTFLEIIVQRISTFQKLIRQIYRLLDLVCYIEFQNLYWGYLEQARYKENSHYN